jgi:hypothetical protein
MVDYPLGIKYPISFPAECCARVEEEEIPAKREFDKATWEPFAPRRRERSVIREALRTYTLQIFLVFARQARDHCPWRADEMDECCREFLRRITIHADYGTDDYVISRYDGSITSDWQRFLEKSDLWRQYDDIRLEVARRQAKKETEPQDISERGRPKQDKTKEIFDQWIAMHVMGRPPKYPALAKKMYPDECAGANAQTLHKIAERCRQSVQRWRKHMPH